MLFFAVQITAKLNIYHQTRSKTLYELTHRKIFYLSFFPLACRRNFENDPFRLKFWLF